VGEPLPLAGCPTPCDPGCEADCHESHQVRYKQWHQPGWSCEQVQRAIAEAAGSAEGKLAGIHRAVVDGFLAEYGTSTLASFKAAQELAWSVRKILDGSGLAAREAIAEAERERLLDLIAARLKVVMAWPGSGCLADAVPWAALQDVLRGLPSAGLEEEAAGPGEAAEAAPSWQAAAEAERERICGILAALKVTLTRPGWGFRAPVNMDVVPWEALVKALGSDGTADGDAGTLARVRKLGETWAGLPAEGGASPVLREAGRVLLERIDGDGEASDGS
jgi:hypothetical protein